MISDTVTEIGYFQFENCAGLTNVVIPDSVTSIGNYAFRDCTALQSIHIPKSVTHIGINAFNGCSGLKSITVDTGNSVYDSRNDCNAIVETASNTLLYGSAGTVIPDTVTALEDYAFSRCTGIESIHIPEGLTAIGDSVFSRCSELKHIAVAPGNTVYDSREDCNAIIRTADNSLLYGCQNTTVPDTVTTIGDSAFFRCDTLTAIHIPRSVTDIGYSVFWGCSGLESMTVDPENPVFDSRDDCNAIVKTAGNEIVWGCRRTVIPDTVTGIGNAAFAGCNSLTAITIPDSVTSIGSTAFYECRGLIELYIPDSMTSIESAAFMNCSNLTVSIPETLADTDSSTFEGVKKVNVRIK